MDEMGSQWTSPLLIGQRMSLRHSTTYTYLANSVSSTDYSNQLIPITNTTHIKPFTERIYLSSITMLLYLVRHGKTAL